MAIIITPVITREDQDAVWQVRQEVFHREMRIPLSSLKLPEDANAFDLLARDKATGEAVAALTMLETTGQRELASRYDLRFPAEARTVRYKQLAVRRRYRRRGISLKLILEGHRLYVEPGRFDFSWLLFNARHASSSSLCQLLGFSPSALTVPSEMGRSRVLIRDEKMADCQEALRRARVFVQSLDDDAAPLAFTSASTLT